jgi:hypothetical protein
MNLDATTSLLQFIETGLQADSEWLEAENGVISYWHFQFRQEFRVKKLDNGSLKWQVKTTIVNSVENSELALKVCNSLNLITGNFAFVYDADSKQIHSLISMSVPIEFDAWQQHLADSCHLSDWFYSQTASTVAEIVGGELNLSYPLAQGSFRETPDPTFWTPLSRKNRPEWIFDSIENEFPDSQTLSDFISDKVGVNPSLLAENSSFARVDLSPSDSNQLWGQIQAGFTTTSLFGRAFISGISIQGIPEGIDLLRLANNLNVDAYDSDFGNLLGSWQVMDGQLVFRQIVLTSEIRALQGTAGFTHFDVQHLWNYTSALSPIWESISVSEPDNWPRSDGTIEPLSTEKEIEILDSIYSKADSLLQGPPTDCFGFTGHQNREFLNIELEETLFVYGYFNPYGPTIGQFGLTTDPESNEIVLLHLERHPTNPDFHVFGRYNGLREVTENLVPLLAEVFTNLPTFIDWDYPTDLPDVFVNDIQAAVREVFSGMASSELLQEANKIKSNLGQPWNYAGEEPSPAYPEEATFQPHDDAVEAYLSMATNPTNVYSMWREIPRAWDGALNLVFSEEGGFSPSLDVGPIPTIYSALGRTQELN